MAGNGIIVPKGIRQGLFTTTSVSLCWTPMLLFSRMRPLVEFQAVIPVTMMLSVLPHSLAPLLFGELAASAGNSLFQLFFWAGPCEDCPATVGEAYMSRAFASVAARCSCSGSSTMCCSTWEPPPSSWALFWIRPKQRASFKYLTASS